MDITFSRDGDYYAVVQDARLSKQRQNFYRLKVASFPYAVGIFPLGWKRGEKVDVEFFGGSLKTPVKVAADLSTFSSKTELTQVNLPGEPGILPFQFVVGDLPERIEPMRQRPDELVALDALNEPDGIVEFIQLLNDLLEHSRATPLVLGRAQRDEFSRSVSKDPAHLRQHLRPAPFSPTSEWPLVPHSLQGEPVATLLGFRVHIGGCSSPLLLEALTVEHPSPLLVKLIGELLRALKDHGAFVPPVFPLLRREPRLADNWKTFGKVAFEPPLPDVFMKWVLLAKRLRVKGTVL